MLTKLGPVKNEKIPINFQRIPIFYETAQKQQEPLSIEIHGISKLIKNMSKDETETSKDNAKK